MFIKGYWKHKRFLDVFIQVLSVSYVGPEYTKLKVLWWNENKHGEPFVIFYEPQTIKITKEENENWEMLCPSIVTKNVT